MSSTHTTTAVDPTELTFVSDDPATVEVYGPADPDTGTMDYLGLVDLHAGTFYSNRTRRTHDLTDTQLEVEAACRARVAELV